MEKGNARIPWIYLEVPYVTACFVVHFRPGELLLAAHVVGSWDVLKSTQVPWKCHCPKIIANKLAPVWKPLFRVQYIEYKKPPLIDYVYLSGVIFSICMSPIIAVRAFIVNSESDNCRAVCIIGDIGSQHFQTRATSLRVIFQAHKSTIMRAYISVATTAPCRLCSLVSHPASQNKERRWS